MTNAKQDSVREVADKIAAKFLRERWSKPLLTDAIEAALLAERERAAQIIKEHRESDKCEGSCWAIITDAIRKDDHHA